MNIGELIWLEIERRYASGTRMSVLAREYGFAYGTLYYHLVRAKNQAGTRGGGAPRHN
jgi:hypothetical protein